MEAPKTKYTLEDVLSDQLAELPESEKQTVLDRVLSLEKRLCDLNAAVGDLKTNVKNLRGDLDYFFRDKNRVLGDWFNAQLQAVSAEAVQKLLEEFLRKETLNELQRKTQLAVEAHFQKEAPELAKAIWSVVLNKIQPHAIKR